MKKPLQAKKSETWPVIVVCAGLVLAVLVVFGQTAHFDFVNYDDPAYVYNNPEVARGLNLRGITWAFTHAECSLYHPLTMISLRLDYQLHGLQAGGYHLTNVALHAASAVLLFLVLRGMTGALWRSAFVAALFAIHPLRAESVAWVAERKDVLAAFFFMLALGAYVRYVRKPDSIGRYLMVAFCFLLALLSKPTTVTLPFVLLLLDFWPLGRMKLPRSGALASAGGSGVPLRGSVKANPALNPNPGLGAPNPDLNLNRGPGVPFWGLVKEKLPLFLLSAGSCVVTCFAAGKAVGSVATVPIPVKIGVALVSYVTYLRQMIWPAGLAAFYPLPKQPFPFWEVVSAFLFLALISGGVWAVWRQRPWLMVGWFWFLGMLVPVLGVVQVGEFLHADRYTYLPQIGLSLLLTWAAAEFCARRRGRRILLGGCASVILLALIVGAYDQTASWRNSESLWTHALACDPGNILARNDLGTALGSDGKLKEAIEQFRQALEINPNHAGSHNNLGAALAQDGKLAEAIQQYRKSVEIEPGYVQARKNLGMALAQAGDQAEAIAQLRKALETDPGCAEARLNLGLVLEHVGRRQEAIAEYRKALDVKTDDVEARSHLADALFSQGALQEAIAQYRKVLEIKPDDAEIRNNLGVALATGRDLDGAIAQYRQALQIKPAYADARDNLGLVLAAKGDMDGAIAQYRQALATAPNDTKVLKNLGAALAIRGFLDDAIEQYRRALEINPDFAGARQGLGRALLRKGDLEGAMACFQKSTLLHDDPLTCWRSLGNDLLQEGDLEEAIVCYEQVAKINPRSAEAWAKLGLAFFQEGDFKRAIDAWQKSLEISPDQANVQNNLAWLLATTPESSLRDGAKAVALAEQAKQTTGGGNPMVLHTLAAAYAEAGRYGEAAETARRALELALAQKNEDLSVKLPAEIKLYEAGKPVRDVPP